MSSLFEVQGAARCQSDSNCNSFLLDVLTICMLHKLHGPEATAAKKAQLFQMPPAALPGALQTPRPWKLRRG